MYNIISYIIYLTITFYITIRVGWICYSNGEIYIRQMLQERQDWVKPVNNLLLIGYYLVNLGFASITLSTWNPVENIGQMIAMIATKTGFIMLVLGMMHYSNLWIITKIKFIKS